MKTKISGICSMATRQLLAELVEAFERNSDSCVEIESTGGVDVARRILAGEAFDLVFLASDAIDKLLDAQCVVPGSRVDLVSSGVAVAVRKGAPLPDITTEETLRQAVLGAAKISYSTGPSGVALAKLFERWGIARQLQGRIVQAPAGVPVAELLASGEVELGFQQLSEMIHAQGIEVLGPLPPAVQIVTIFSGAVGAKSLQAKTACAVLEFMNSPQAAAAKLRQGMTPL